MNHFYRLRILLIYFCLLIINKQIHSFEKFSLSQTPKFDSIYPWSSIPSSSLSNEDVIMIKGCNSASGIGNYQILQSFFNIHNDFDNNDDMIDISIEFDEKRLFFQNEKTKKKIKIDKMEMEIKVVKVWKQYGLDRLKEKEVDVPELLINNDKIKLTGGWDIRDVEFVNDDGSGGNGKSLKFSKEKVESLDCHLKDVSTIFPADEGGVEFKMKTNWNGTNNHEHREMLHMAETEGSYTSIFRVYSHTNGMFYGVYDDGVHWEACSIIDDNYIFKDEWVRVTFTWNTATNNLKMYFDGNKVCDDDVVSLDTFYPYPLTDSMSIGGRSTSCDCLFDKLKMFNYQPSDVEVQNENYVPQNIILDVDFDSIAEMESKNVFITPLNYYPPIIPDEMNTDIPKNTTKQFWIKIPLYKFFPAGKYKSSLIVKSKGIEIDRIPVVIDLVEFDLMPTDKIHMMYYGNIFSYQDHEIHLKDMAKHGMNGIFISQSDLSYLNQTIQKIKQYPEYKHLVVSSNTVDLDKKIKLVEEFGFKPVFYGIDEPNDKGEETIAHIIKSNEIHKAGGSVCTAITYATTGLLEDSESLVYDLEYNSTHSLKEVGITHEPLDWINYHATYMGHKNFGADHELYYDYVLGIFAGNITKKNVIETYYIQSWIQQYKFIRFMSGIFLYMSTFDGFFPYHYISRYDSPLDGDPFVDDDRPTSQYRDLNTVYMKKDGIISTLQWEAMLEGLTDYRFLLTLESTLNKYRFLKRNIFDEKLNWLKKEALKEFLAPNELESKSGQIFEDLRDSIMKEYSIINSEYIKPFKIGMIFLAVSPIIIILIIFALTLIICCTFNHKKKNAKMKKKGYEKPVQLDDYE